MANGDIHETTWQQYTNMMCIQYKTYVKINLICVLCIVNLLFLFCDILADHWFAERFKRYSRLCFKCRSTRFSFLLSCIAYSSANLLPYNWLRFSKKNNNLRWKGFLLKWLKLIRIRIILTYCNYKHKVYIPTIFYNMHTCWLASLFLSLNKFAYLY